MLELKDNLFNARQGRHQPKLKLWRYAGLMLTYRCSAACRFCYYYCSPAATGLMSVDTAIESWQGLIRIADDSAKVHITGGEPFLYFDRLAEILKAARGLRLTPLDCLETNGDIWADESELTDRLRFLADCGLDRIKVSWDVFHEEFIDIDKVRQFVRVARSVLGPDRVLVRWDKHLAGPTGIRTLAEDQKKQILLTGIKADSCRFTGRAAEALAPWVSCSLPEAFREQCCQHALLGAKGVHIDPFGNVFSGQCSGMILANVNQIPLDAVWKTFEPDRMEFWKILFEKGPFGLLAPASDRDFHQLDHYASKCHLCAHIRRFFFDIAHETTIIGPKDCYGKFK